MKRLCNMLDDYLEGKLESRDREVFEGHLLECEHCKREVEAFNQIEGYLNSIPRVKVPDDFSAIILEKIHSHKKRMADLYIYSIVAIISFISTIFAVSLIGWENVVENLIYAGKSIYQVVHSFLSAVFVLSEVVYNIITPEKANGFALTVAFVLVLMVFIRSIKVFSGVKR